MSSNSLCHDLDLRSHRNADLSVFCNNNENSRWSVTRNEKNLALYILLNTHQCISDRVFIRHQVICVIV